MIKFGTSGFRGIIADNFTKESVQRVAYALSKKIKTNNVIPIGYDNRFLGKQFAMWFSEVLVAYGKKVLFFENSVPTPLIAFETKNVEFGVIVTASHNPYFYNGIKVFQTGGRETTSKQNEYLEKIANQIDYSKIKTIPFEDAVKNKQITLTKNISKFTYFIINLIKNDVRKRRIKILFNNMNGSATESVEAVFKGLDIDIKSINTGIDPNFGFGLPSPYEHNLTQQAEIVKKEKYDFGFALDGDGDRISFLDENGKFYDCNYVSALIFDYYLTQKKFKCDFVKNCAMTSLLEKIAKKNNQKVLLAKVGFKNIAEILIKNKDAFIGAESNGIALKSHIYHKGGIFGGALVSSILSESKKSFSELINDLKQKYNFPCEAVEYAYPFNEKQKDYIQSTIFDGKKLPKITFENKQNLIINENLIKNDKKTLKNNKILQKNNYFSEIINKNNNNKFSLKIKNVSYDDGLKIYFENDYWCVIRFSGNENVIRLFAEMPTRELADSVISQLEKFIKLKTRQI